MVALLQQAIEALQRIKEEPYGCAFCDSGVLRTPNNPAKDHEDTCPFKLANDVLLKLEFELSHVRDQ